MKITFQPNTIDFYNRAVSYGDGCFTTALWRDNVLHLQEAHLARLQLGCEKLMIAGFDACALKACLTQHVFPQLTLDCAIKILVSVSAGGRGYQRSASPELEVYISQHPIPAHYQAWQQQGIALGVSDVTLAKQPILAGIKHLNRLEQVLIKQKNNLEAEDVLVLDSDGMMVEVSSANIFWRCTQQWYTPDLHESGVAGVVRQKIMQIQQAQNPVSEVRAKPEALIHADEVFVCNSIMGMVPVHTLQLNQEQSIHFDIASPYFQQLINCI